ncbi:PIN domain-containing protein [Tundrisphaera sp. TA3]|uniref:PIN domain-containing protein n=1 Tax=Tundrisphaera sp. TA3 TaxID=3435775 RepID=UPI003EBB7445
MTMDQVVELLGGSSVPVLCLDTCVLMDFVRVDDRQSRDLTWARALRNHVNGDSNVVRLVLTYLVKVEWAQNRDKLIEGNKAALASLRRSMQILFEDGQHRGQEFDRQGVDGLFDGVSENLVQVVDQLLDRAIVVDRDDSSATRALNRVEQKKRPSHDGSIKDSIHWEHYLELSRRLRADGSRQRVMFVSSDKAAFWRSSALKTATDTMLHADLLQEAGDVELEFHGEPGAAMGKLGISGRS